MLPHIDNTINHTYLSLPYCLQQYGFISTLIPILNINYMVSNIFVTKEYDKKLENTHERITDLFLEFFFHMTVKTVLFIAFFHYFGS